MFLDDYKYGKRTKEETNKVIIASIVESIQNAEKDRQRCLFNIVNRGSYKITENDDNDARSELIVEKAKKCGLHHYCLSLEYPFIQKC